MPKSVSADIARKRAIGNKNSRWLGRNEPNRLEPECWPVLNPSFQFEPGQKIFTIGSCFARNIESHLSELGYNIPMLSLSEVNENGEFANQFLNKYTTPSIYQELKWAYDILQRDNIVSKSDTDPLFFTKDEQTVFDMHLVSQASKDYDSVFARRQAVYKTFVEAFSADIVIITLGQTETYFDTETGLYVYVTGVPVSLRREQLKRFEFVELDYSLTYEYLKKSIDLLNSVSPKKFLVTTSPVPTNRTYTSQDVITQSLFSKSISRAVAGQIAVDHENVDYFPSFESVMLSKQAYVWEDDLQHVNFHFVGRIVSRLVEYYTDISSEVGEAETPGLPDTDTLQHFNSLMQYGDINNARALYLSFPEALTGIKDPLFHVHAARLNMFDNNKSRALSHMEPALAHKSRWGREHIKLIDVLYWAGQRADALALVRRLFDDAKDLPNEALIMMRGVRHMMPKEDQILLLKEHYWGQAGEAAAMNYIADLYVEMGQTDEAITALMKACSASDNDHWPFVKLGNLLAETGHPMEAAEYIQKALDIDDSSKQLKRRLAFLLFEAQDLRNAAAYAKAFLADSPKDIHGHALLGRILEADQDFKPALKHFKKALELKPTNKVFQKAVTRLEQLISDRK